MKYHGDYRHLTPRVTTRKRYGLTLGAYRVAYVLAMLGPSTSIEIAEHCGASRSAVRKMIGRLRFGDVPFGPVRVCGFERRPMGPPIPQYTFGVEPDYQFHRQARGAKGSAKYRANNPARVLIQKRIAKGIKASPFDGLGT